MPLSLNEIRDRAHKFSKEWQDEDRERAEKDTFWNDFFNVFGVSRKRVASFEQPVKKLNNKTGFIDLFWKGKLIVEHKSKGKDLEAAFEQATDYFHGLKVGLWEMKLEMDLFLSRPTNGLKTLTHQDQLCMKEPQSIHFMHGLMTT